jgi:molybdate transport system regulatory protein
MHIGKSRSRKRTSTSPTFRGRIWIDGPEGTFLGYGRIILLERIHEYGSITKAARSMAMSYRHAWELVDSMNRQSIRPFVEAVTGGRGGGGARLTQDGESAIRLFWKFYADLQHFLKQEQTKLSHTLRPQKKRKTKTSAT